VAIVNSLWVSSAAAAIGLAVGFPVAWLAARTTMPGRRWVSGGMWLALLLPSWLPSLGWVRLVQPDGVMYRLGLNWPWVTHLIMGPFGVVLVLGLRCAPFSYLAISAALNGLGQEFEDAARVHGATRFGALRLIVPILAPAIMSALAIGFAESISDFGVAATLAYSSNFPLATYALYGAIGNFPPSFPLAAGMSWLLVAAVAIPLALQARALRGRSYAILSGRTRQAVRRRLSRFEAIAAGSGLALLFLVMLGIPGFGAVSGSLLGDYGGSFTLTLVNYQALFQQAGLLGPLERSLMYGLIAATVTVFLGYIAARLLSSARRTRATGAMDYVLLASVALPGVVFGAGYIFAYNLPIMSTLHIDLYQTVQLLIIAYIASSLPTNARVLVGPVSQIQGSLRDAARAHGAGAVSAWARGVMPVVSRPIMMAWLYTFCGVFLELPLSQLLYAPGSPPASIAIEDNLSNYHFGVGMAQAVLAVFIAFVVVAVVLGGYRLLAPAGWRRIGRTVRG
jgi:iron(III) transport system permease protein